MREIPLTRGKVAIVSDEDYEWAMQWRWQASKYPHKSGVLWYATRNPRYGPRSENKRRFILMHREIALRAGLPLSRWYDHRDGDGLNNERHNLRPATVPQNMANARKMVGKSSQFKWVYWNKRERKWIVKLSANGLDIYIGAFRDELEAGRIANEAAIAIHGDFARLNPV